MTVSVGLTSCVSEPPQRADPILGVLTKVAEQVRLTTNQISEIQQVSSPEFREPSPRDPKLLEKITVIDFVGSPSKLLASLADKTGYRFVELGAPAKTVNARGNPFGIVIAVRASKQSVIDVLRDVAAQVGHGVVVSVSEAKQEIRLEYL